MSKDTKEFIKMMSGFLLGVALLFCLVLAGINRMEFAGELAEIDQLRANVQSVDQKNAFEIYALAVKKNQKIASEKAYNKIWWADIFIPDGWNSVELIEIPQTK